MITTYRPTKLEQAFYDAKEYRDQCQADYNEALEDVHENLGLEALHSAHRAIARAIACKSVLDDANSVQHDALMEWVRE